MRIRINIGGVTEENRLLKAAKFDGVADTVRFGKRRGGAEGAVSEEPAVKSKNPRVFCGIKFNLDCGGGRDALRKIDKALGMTGFILGAPLKSAKSGEGFCFKAQEDLTDRWCAFFSKITRGAYDLTIGVFGLPEIGVVSKAGDLEWRGRILYHPETGAPIRRAEWDGFVRALERFLNRGIAGAAERIILDSTALGKILDRMLRTNTLQAVRGARLKDLKCAGRAFDWISESVRNMRSVGGGLLTRDERARIEVLRRSAAEKITRVSNEIKSDIRQILIDGVANRKSKTQVSQAVFDRMVGRNMDFQRIADTEIQRASVNAFVREEVRNTPEGGRAYFKRLEVVDGNTCEYCRKINGRIAVWSETPLADGAVRDPYAELAIWEGKEWDGKRLARIADAPVSVCHPWCRGVWIGYDPKLEG